MNTTTHDNRQASVIMMGAVYVCIGVVLMLWPSGVHGQAADRLGRSDTTMAPGPGAGGERWFVNLPGGGRIWASEDPSMGDPVLNVSGGSVAALQGRRLTEPITFRGYANYAPFIERAELLIYRGRDQTLKDPLAALPVEPGVSMEMAWDGQLPAGHGLRPGGSLLYVMRAYGPGGQMDETYPRRIELVSPQQLRQRRTGNQAGRGSAPGTQNSPETSSAQSSEGDASGPASATESVFGRSNLRVQNIPIVGSAIRVQGQDIPADKDQLTINGRSIPVDRDQRFVAEYLLPAGSHRFDIRLDGAGTPIERTLQVAASAGHFFMVGIADVTASKNGLHGNLEPIEGSEQFREDLLVEGRMAFYLKAKVKGKYLITAHTDTREEQLQHMFDGFFGKSPQDLFRRLDPDRYYPVYGDEGSTYRDINSQGKLYVRVNWDKSELLWGNYATRFTGTETARYQRGLYGGALRYNSPGATQWGQSKLQLATFGADAQTVYGHNEFVATGASVYYLRHTDVLAGSEQITVELRDVATGQTTRQLTLQPDVDYEIDYLQGRLILKRPVAQMAGGQGQELIRDTPQAGLQNVLLIDYEYIPSGLNTENMTAGARGKAWLGEHVGVGGTYVNEGRGAADDYQLAGGDLTLRAGRGTYLKVEAAQSERTQAPVFFSDNGGMTFTETIPDGGGAPRSGQAYRIEGQASLGGVFGADSSYWDRNPWTLGSWWSRRDGGFSVTRRDFGYDTREWGAEVDGQLGAALQLRGRVSTQQVSAPGGGAPTSTPLPGTAARALSQARLIGDYRISDHHSVSSELRQVRESMGGPEGQALLGAVGYQARLAGGVELYGVGQTELWSQPDYRDNDRLTGGGRYLWGERTSLGGEYSRGARGEAFSVNASHQFTGSYTLYGRYGWSPDYPGNALFGPSQQDGFSVGQRWRATDRLNVSHESQQIQSGAETGLGHSLGLDFMPAKHWQLGLRLGGARLQAQTGQVDRRSATATVGARDGQTNWSSKFEYRGDFGAERRTQLVTTQRIRHKINDSWRVATRVNYADTDDKATAVGDARFLESSFGVSLRPPSSTRWGLLGKVTYLYDRQSIGQAGPDAEALTGSNFDQRSLVGALEAIYRPHQRVELTAKAAVRMGEIRTRSGGPYGRWLTSTTRFGALQARYQVWGQWDALAEGRWRENLQAEDARRGILVGIDRRITDFLHMGAGYNFTDFSDRLTDLDYNDRGWFINIVGFY